MAEWFAHTFPNVVYLGWTGETGWWTAIVQTLYMTFISALIGGLLGLIFGIGVGILISQPIITNKAAPIPVATTIFTELFFIVSPF